MAGIAAGADAIKIGEIRRFGALLQSVRIEVAHRMLKNAGFRGKAPKAAERART
jgi:hypothetical protein